MKKVLAFLMIAILLLSVQTSAFGIGLNIEIRYDELSQEDVGEVVKNLQLLLRDLGYFQDTVDQKFGHSTGAAVFNFQRVNGLPATGVADPTTHEALYQNEALPAPELPALRISAVTVDQKEGAIDCTILNETDETITELYFWLVCLDKDGQLLSEEGTAEPAPLGGFFTLSGGEESYRVTCAFAGQVQTAFAGICGYRTESGAVTRYAPDQVFFACSDGSVLIPLNREEPEPAEELVFDVALNCEELGLTDFARIP